MSQKDMVATHLAEVFASNGNARGWEGMSEDFPCFRGGSTKKGAMRSVKGTRIEIGSYQLQFSKFTFLCIFNLSTNSFIAFVMFLSHLLIVLTRRKLCFDVLHFLT